jgi:hypothetical protein
MKGIFLGATLASIATGRLLRVPLADGAEKGPGRAAQQPACQMKVVPCNYAYLYSGTFYWTVSLSGPAGQSSWKVQTAIQKGVVSCGGTQTDTSNGQTTVANIGGAGLFAVEFNPGSNNKLEYVLTAACPTPPWMGAPGRPAELGHDPFHYIDPQPATAIGQASLKGSLTYPAPETDTANGVTGTVTVSWSLTNP